LQNKELHWRIAGGALLSIIPEVLRTSIFVVLLMELNTKGAAHRNIEVIGYCIIQICCGSAAFG